MPSLDWKLFKNFQNWLIALRTEESRIFGLTVESKNIEKNFRTYSEHVVKQIS